ncbi:MAG: phosphatase PAP2 family protein [Lewinellaceae bacterium]|nr:phosphatase PAP2 family protein [Saprospiraceae bacterium]MCB9337014.1 phosphatase PAP2 family protein [Lewinellaceae bacterium]
MFKNLFVCFSLLAAFSCPVFSQVKRGDVYRMEGKKEAPIIATSIGLSLSGALLENKTAARNGGDISLHTILSFDENLHDPLSKPASSLSHWMLGGTALLPFALLSDVEIRSDAGKVGVLLSETVLLTNGLAAASRLLDRQHRLTTGLENQWALQATPDTRQAFISGHTAAAASLSFFTAKVWTDYHPDSKWKPAIWITAAALPAATGYLRFKTGKQNLANVASGYVVGALVGYLVPHLHKEKKDARRKLRLSSTFIGQTPVFVVKYRL